MAIIQEHNVSGAGYICLDISPDLDPRQTGKMGKIMGLMTILFGLPLFHSIVYAESSLSSFAYVLQADSFAKNKKSAVEQLVTCGRDWVIIDSVYNEEEPWTPGELNTIRCGKAGRKIMAYVSIGEAEDYRPYWRREWSRNGKLTPAAPEWLISENADWESNYRVKYWNGKWKRIVLAMIDNLMDCGFDGVYLDIVDGFEAFERDGNKFIDNRINPETNHSYRRDMVEWVKEIANHIRLNNPEVIIIPQNGSQLLVYKDYLEVISAIGIEDLFMDGDRLQPLSHTGHVLNYLKMIVSDNKPVLLIEYPKKRVHQQYSQKMASESGMIWLITDRQLKTLGVSGNGPITITENSKGKVHHELSRKIEMERLVARADGFGGYARGGVEGAVVSVESVADLERYAEMDIVPYVIEVTGTLQIGNRLRIGSNKTIRSAEPAATLVGQVGFRKGANNIVLERLYITNPDGEGEGDGICIKPEVTNVFVTHCTLYDCLDGCLDISNGSDRITVSWCKFYYTHKSDHRFVSLIGSSDRRTQDRGRLHVTMHHNWWSSLCKERLPRVRYGYVHLYNNYYNTSLEDNYCIGVGTESSLRLENNCFEGVVRPWEDKSAGGKCRPGKIGWNEGNVFVNCSIPTWAVNAWSETFCVPYEYILDDGACVADIVRKGAGADGRKVICEN